jgi:hypothetical protein
MNSLRKLSVLILFVSFLHLPGAQSAEAPATNPFPGIPYDGEIPGYTVEIDCGPGGDNSSSGVDCGIGRIPWFACPEWSSSDGRNGYANDGPPGDPHKKVGFAKRFCRNSWTPPTTAADEEDFRNRQQLAVAAATLESQAYSAANPGEQKCITWGPIVHANGISTASGGVCANVVGTKPDGSTIAVAPSRVGSEPVAQPSSSIPAAESVTAAIPSAVTPDPVPSSNSGAQTLIPFIDLSQYGFGRPFSRVVKGNIPASQCPTGFDAATNPINTGFGEYGATECWPSNAWAAYSIGGDVWTKFKSTNGTINAEAEASRRIQVNAIRALALQQAQQLANQTIGIKRCASWNGFGESGQECAYIPVQNNILGGIVISASDSSTTQIKSAKEVVVAKLSSEPGQSQTEWEKSESYTAFVCPGGAGKSLSLDLNGTISKSDDIWTLSCIEVTDLNSRLETLTVGLPSETGTVKLPSETATTLTPILSESSTVINLQDSSIIDSRLTETQTAITADIIQFKGTISQVREVVLSLQLPDLESKALTASLAKLTNIKPISKVSRVSLPNSPELVEIAKSLTPLVCKVSGLTVQSKKSGVCQISYSLEGKSGNLLETTKKITFRK